MAVKDPQVVLKEAALVTKGESADPETLPQSEAKVTTMPKEQQVEKAAQVAKTESADPEPYPQAEAKMITLPVKQQNSSSSLKDSGSSREKSSPSLRSDATSSAAASEGTDPPLSLLLPSSCLGCG